MSDTIRRPAAVLVLLLALPAVAQDFEARRALKGIEMSTLSLRDFCVFE